ncbi:MAG: helix-turn-helix domain-containing protein [Eubacterium sp.]|nr:helix-turn-helix domain-containing protein [Eubacterium sp.]
MRDRHSSPYFSRQYMIEENFELYYFTDMHFKNVELHSHDYYEFYFFEEGGVDMEIDGGRYPLNKGDLLIVPPGVSHRAEVLSPELTYSRFVFWISVPFMKHLYDLAEEYRYLPETAERGRYAFHMDPLSFNQVRGALLALLEEKHTDRFAGTEGLNLSIRSLLLLLTRIVYEQDNYGQPDLQSRYEILVRYIDMHLAETITLDRIADELYLSKYYLAHLFRAETGMTIHQYITKKRLSACSSAILAGSSIPEACFSNGFRDYSAFYRAFRKEYGISPSEYRRLAKKQIGSAGNSAESDL